MPATGPITHARERGRGVGITANKTVEDAEKQSSGSLCSQNWTFWEAPANRPTNTRLGPSDRSESSSSGIAKVLLFACLLCLTTGPRSQLLLIHIPESVCQTKEPISNHYR